VGAAGGGTPMKTCQFCFEPIRLEAVKCRYCGADVTQAAATAPPAADRPAADDRHVVYVLDKDLIRFGKFAGAVLALVIVVGALFYGIDIKQLRSEIEGDRAAVAQVGTEVKKIADELEASLDETRRLQAAIGAQANSARANARRAEEALANILETQRRAMVTFEEIVATRDGTLSTRKATVTVAAGTTAAAAGAATAASAHGKLWPNGTVLHVRFLGGTAADHAKIERWAMAWSRYANISFVFDDSPNAEIRISFDESSGSWSYVGRDSVAIVGNTDAATMNLAWVDEANVLHQFGHVLGLQHEHQNPFEPVPWDREAVYATFTAPPYSWNRETIEFNILRPYPRDAYPIAKPFDPQSVMLYAFADDLTEGDVRLVAGTRLSDGDKTFIAKLYPKP
jgi:hypothetical protein